MKTNQRPAARRSAQGPKAKRVDVDRSDADESQKRFTEIKRELLQTAVEKSAVSSPSIW